MSLLDLNRASTLSVIARLGAAEPPLTLALETTMNRIAAGWLLACCGLVPVRVSIAQRPASIATLDSSTLKDQHALQIFLKVVEESIVSAAQAMPADKYGFAPTDGEFRGVRTFGRQVKHLAATNYILAAAEPALTAPPPAPAAGHCGVRPLVPPPPRLEQHADHGQRQERDFRPQQDHTLRRRAVDHDAEHPCRRGDTDDRGHEVESREEARC